MAVWISRKPANSAICSVICTTVHTMDSEIWVVWMDVRCQGSKKRVSPLFIVSAGWLGRGAPYVLDCATWLLPLSTLSRRYVRTTARLSSFYSLVLLTPSLAGGRQLAHIRAIYNTNSRANELELSLKVDDNDRHIWTQVNNRSNIQYSLSAAPLP